MSKRFQHSAEKPFHISVGAVLVSGEGQVLVHRVLRDRVPERFRPCFGELAEAYTLMRESLEDDETLEAAVMRGLAEEFGAQGNLGRYLGSIQATITAEEVPFEKTTLYFEVACTEQGVRPPDDEEAHFTELEWVDPLVLIERMQEQGQHISELDFDESKILETYVRTR